MLVASLSVAMASRKWMYSIETNEIETLHFDLDVHVDAVLLKQPEISQ